MSGGSYDYIYSKIEEIVLRNTDKDPRRKAFQKLLRLVGQAMHDIEWVDSSDCSPGDEHEAIDKVFNYLKLDPMIVAKAEAYDQVIKLCNSFNHPLTGEKK